VPGKLTLAGPAVSFVAPNSLICALPWDTQVDGLHPVHDLRFELWRKMERVMCIEPTLVV
jgi:hypothetical protein